MLLAVPSSSIGVGVGTGADISIGIGIGIDIGVRIGVGISIGIACSRGGKLGGQFPLPAQRFVLLVKNEHIINT